MNGIRRFFEGIGIIPKSASTASAKGELEVIDSTGKLNYHNGTSVSPMVTEAHTATLTNKSIDADANTITNIENADIKALAAIDATKIGDGSVSNTEFQQLGSLGSAAVGISDVQTLTNKTIDADLNTLSNIENADIKALAAIDATKIGDGTVTNTELSYINTLSSNVQTQINDHLSDTTTHGTTGAIVGISDIQTLTNKTIDADLNTLSNIENADIKALAAIDASKIADGSVSNTEFQQLASLGSAAVGISDTQTLTNKTLTAPIIDVATLDGQASNPSSPSAGNYKLFVSDSTQKLSLMDSAGTVTSVGSSGTGINFIVNGDAEAGTTGVNTYSDASSSRPTDGTGGAPNVTITASSSSPISGAKSFVLAKDAANRQGQGWSIDFSVDVANKAKVQTISFDYMVNSGTFVAGSSSTESDVIVYIYDVTNAVLIEPSNIKLFSSSTSLSDRYVSTFQTSSNSTSYRLILHIQSTSALAYELKLDNISVSPQGTTLAPVITDWKSYTPTVSGFTLSSSKMYWRRVGDSMHIHGTMVFAGAATGTIAFNIPSGYSLDTSKQLRTSYGKYGTVYAVDAGVADKEPFSIVQDSTSLTQFFFSGTTNAGTAISFDATNPFTWGANDEIKVELVVPILGWSSGLEIGDNYSGREISASYALGSAQSLANATDVKIQLNTKLIDKTNSFDAATNYRFNIPSAGTYFVVGKVSFAAGNTTGARYIGIRKNNSVVDTGAQSSPGNATDQTTVTHAQLIDCSAGDYLELWAYQSSGGAINANQASIQIYKLSSPAAIASGEKVAARYKTDAGQSIPSVAHTIVNFEDKSIDTHGSVTTGASWKFTAQTSGIYKVKAAVQYTSASWTVGFFHVISIYKNGAAYTEKIIQNPYTGTYWRDTNTISDEVELKAKDYIDVRIYHQEATARTLHVSSAYNYISITKL